jgi:hypothetical protein
VAACLAALQLVWHSRQQATKGTGGQWHRAAISKRRQWPAAGSKGHRRAAARGSSMLQLGQRQRQFARGGGRRGSRLQPDVVMRGTVTTKWGSLSPAARRTLVGLMGSQLGIWYWHLLVEAHNPLPKMSFSRAARGQTPHLCSSRQHHV